MGRGKQYRLNQVVNFRLQLVRKYASERSSELKMRYFTWLWKRRKNNHPKRT